MPAPSSRPQHVRKPRLPRLSKGSVDRVHLLDSTAQEAEALAITKLLGHLPPRPITVIGETYGDINAIAKELAVESTVSLPDNPKLTERTLILTKSLHALHDEAALEAVLAAMMKPDALAILEVTHHLSGPKEQKRNHTNYNPRVLARQLAAKGYKVERTLSVATVHSSGRLAKLMPDRVLLAVEGLLHPTPAARLFGPSVYFLIRRMEK